MMQVSFASLNPDQIPNTEAALGLAHTRIGRWSLYALVTFPVIDYTLRYHGDPIGSVWSKLVLLALIWLAATRYIAGVRPRWFTWNRFAIAYVVFCLGLLFAGLTSPLISLEGFRMDVYDILFVFLIPFVVQPEDVEKLLHIGASLAILTAIDGVYQYVMKVPIPASWTSSTEVVHTRVFSVLISSNEMGAYMALMTPIIAGLAYYTKDRWLRWLFAAGTMVCLLALLLTFTRGALFALILSVLLVSLWFDRRLLIALAVLTVVAFFLPPVQHRIADLFSPVYWLKSAQEGGRIAKWNTAYDKMSGNPLFGVGLGRYGGAVASDNNLGVYSDNYYAKILGESGLLGLTIFVTMHLALLRDMFKNAARQVDKRTRYLMLGGVAGILAVLIHNSVENVFEFSPMSLSYFLYATLFLIWGRSVAENAPLNPNHPDK
ncbi:O-antigen ligase domain-containing protein [Alicyclobacillaceae bacterium I2511]|nr:O-antigen ligase domain-containing protein [Alicyclobacillaceae bacterium I2511]